METYTGNPSNFNATVDVWLDGDLADEADNTPALKQFADNDAALAARATADEVSVAAFQRNLMLKNWNPQGTGPASGGATVVGACRSSSDHSWWFCGGSSTSGKAWKSTDGAVSWTDMAMPTTGINGAVLDICADASGNVQVIFSGVSNNQTYFWNGASWVSGVANIPTPGGSVWRTHFFKGKFVTIGGAGTIAGCYVDPAAPTVATAIPTSTPPGTIGNVGVSRCYLANNFLFYCPLQQTGGWPFMAKIDDPTTSAGWTFPSIAITTNEGITGLDYSTADTKYMAAVANTAGGSTIPLTGSTRFFTSPDGTTWTVAAGTIPDCVCGLVAMNGFWVAYTTTGKIYYSTDVGATWTWSELAVGVFALAETLAARLLKTSGAEQLLALSLNASAPGLRSSLRIG